MTDRIAEEIQKALENQNSWQSRQNLVSNAPEWLRWQQGEIDRLEKRVDALTDKLAESGELLVEALTVLDWYAGEQYGDVQFFPPIPDIPILHDCGEKARSVLSKYANEMHG